MIDTCDQFHQHFTHNFFVQKFHTQFFCTYSLGLYFFGARISAQKLLKNVSEMIDTWTATSGAERHDPHQRSRSSLYLYKRSTGITLKIIFVFIYFLGITGGPRYMRLFICYFSYLCD
jgi:hypothetical protein